MQPEPFILWTPETVATLLIAAGLLAFLAWPWLGNGKHGLSADNDEHERHWAESDDPNGTWKARQEHWLRRLSEITGR